MVYHTVIIFHFGSEQSPLSLSSTYKRYVKLKVEGRLKSENDGLGFMFLLSFDISVIKIIIKDNSLSSFLVELSFICFPVVV